MTALSESGMLPRRSEGVRVLRGGSRTVLVSSDGLRHWTLNETAAAIWELCDGNTSVDEMAEAAATACAVDLEVAAADIERVLDGLTSADLVCWERRSPRMQQDRSEAQ